MLQIIFFNCCLLRCVSLECCGSVYGGFPMEKLTQKNVTTQDLAKSSDFSYATLVFVYSVGKCLSKKSYTMLKCSKGSI